MQEMSSYLERIRLDAKSKGEINVRVTPNSSLSKIISYENGVIHAKLNSPPDKGKANKELIQLLKKGIGIKTQIIKGEKSREKILRVLE